MKLFSLAGLAVLLCMTFLCQFSVQAKTLQAGASWTNELGSVFTINNIGTNGLLSGTYTTAVGCDAGQPQPVTGWYYPGSGGGAMVFSANFQGCNSVTSWSGQYNNNTGIFTTLWYLTAAGAPVWNGINAGTNTFTPTSSKK